MEEAHTTCAGALTKQNNTQHIVTNLLLCALEADVLTYLLTYNSHIIIIRAGQGLKIVIAINLTIKKINLS